MSFDQTTLAENTFYDICFSVGNIQTKSKGISC